MKILYVIDKLPCPAFAGVHLRTLHIGKQLARRHEVKTVYVGPENQLDESRYEASCKELGKIDTFVFSAAKPGTFRAEIGHKFWQHRPDLLAKGVKFSEQQRFEKLADEYDLIWYETLIPAARFRYFGKSKAIADIDDLNHIKWSQLSKQNRGIRQKIANSCIESKWYKAEMAAVRQFDKIGLCSESDKAYLSKKLPDTINKVYIIPNGFSDVPARLLDKTICKPYKLGFIGVLEYKPNLEGLRWFIEQVWPKILEREPETTLRIVGKLSRKVKPPQGPNIEYTDYVADVTDEFDSWTAMVVPLLSGGGTRLKILEAFARGCPVVSTTTGAYGLEVNDDNIIICDEPNVFCDKTIQLARDSEKQKQMSLAGRKTFEENYNWDIIGDRIDEIINKQER